MMDTDPQLRQPLLENIKQALCSNGKKQEISDKNRNDHNNHQLLIVIKAVV